MKESTTTISTETYLQFLSDRDVLDKMKKTKEQKDFFYLWYHKSWETQFGQERMFCILNADETIEKLTNEIGELHVKCNRLDSENLKLQQYIMSKKTKLFNWFNKF